MKEPQQPKKPIKPLPPNKDQKHHKHVINIEHLFLKEIYYDDNGKEISAEEYDLKANYAFEKESKEFTPSLSTIISLLPKDIKPEDVYFDFNGSPDSWHGNWLFDDLKIYYTTPYNYEEELEKYNAAMSKYDKEWSNYKLELGKYKKDQEEYLKYKNQQKLEKKKKELEERLNVLNKELK